MKELTNYAKSVIQKHPDLKPQIEEIINLCKSEIEEGSSVQNEVDAAYWAIKDLLSL